MICGWDDAYRATLERRLLAQRRIEPNGCWTWVGVRNSAGYGLIQARRYTAAGHSSADRVHRVAYRLFVGAIPPGLTVDHLCFNRACINPSHLEAVTNAVNVKRGSVNIKRALTQEVREEVRRAYQAGGVSMRKLAAARGVGMAVIWRAIRGDSRGL